jgi:hypothetical protein
MLFLVMPYLFVTPSKFCWEGITVILLILLVVGSSIVVWGAVLVFGYLTG